jgi:spore germination protein (amino acid permease)
VKEEIAIGNKEGLSILIIGISTQLFLNFPRIMAESAGTAGWIVTIYVTLVSLALLFVISKLYKGFEGKDLIDIGEMTGGHIVRIVVGLMLFIYYIFANAIVLREFGEDLKIIALTGSPISFVLAFFIVGMVIGAFLGLEAVGRLGAIIIPIIAIGFIIIAAGSFRFFNFSNLFPILGTGAYNIFVGGVSKISIFSGLSLLFLLPPFIKSHKNFMSVGFKGILISSVFLIIGILAYLLVFPYPKSLESFLPIYELSRIIDYGRFFQRIESMFVIIWTSTALIYLSIGLFFIVYILKKTFKLEYHKPLILPVAVITSTLSILPQSLMSTVNLETIIFRNFGWTTTFGMTLILLVVANIVKKRIRKGSVKNEK